jgi:hypothetical protein
MERLPVIITRWFCTQANKLLYTQTVKNFMRHVSALQIQIAFVLWFFIAIGCLFIPYVGWALSFINISIFYGVFIYGFLNAESAVKLWDWWHDIPTI